MGPCVGGFSHVFIIYETTTLNGQRFKMGADTMALRGFVWCMVAIGWAGGILTQTFSNFQAKDLG